MNRERSSAGRAPERLVEPLRLHKKTDKSKLQSFSDTCTLREGSEPLSAFLPDRETLLESELLTFGPGSRYRAPLLLWRKAGHEHAPEVVADVQDAARQEERAIVYDLATKARIESAPMEPRVHAPYANKAERALERFLEMPAPVVLIVLWPIGAALLVGGGLVLYSASSQLLGLVAEAGVPSGAWH